MDLKGEIRGITTVFRYSYRKILLSRRLFITLVIGLFVVFIMAYAGAETSDTWSMETGADLMDMLLLFFFMPILAMIYGTSLIRDEIEDKSIMHTVTSPMRRETVYIAYYLALSFSVSFIMICLTTVGYLAFFLQAGMGLESLNLFLSICLLAIIGSFVYSTLFLFLSVLIRDSIYAGLFYAFIWETLIGSIPGSVRLMAIKHYIRSMGSSWVTHGSLAYYDATPFGKSAATLLVVSMIFITMGIFIFLEKEFS